MAGQARVGEAAGPYDFADLANSPDELANSHLDLGSVLVPVVEGGQVSVEMSVDHQPEAVYLLTPVGRVSVAAYAAPKSPGQWREVVGELAESIRAEGAEARTENGHWGREIFAEVPGDECHRFIGVDGPRWMVRCVASGPPETAEQLAQLARAVLAESVVRRGNDPYPPREPLPLILPDVLAEQVRAAQQQMVDEGQLALDDLPPDFADGGVPQEPLVSDAQPGFAEPQPGEQASGQSAPGAPAGGPEGARRSRVSRGTAMQQLRRRR
ncbi:hypothetical protein GOARA_064_01260 [Gordonia araii NBRC 100433]|uniref:DUF3710 domain-containing protein n=1 Tax=Gordonia araii NBRC 100433 TaxID=1073574 RepID=G7H5J9_9ACTN|nr:DUF3710 domain-containing protein [Gordonia araii]NNG95837.1 DUF3710 domain-containing protein [Gordonia araii NBRC 100433]GAB11124.1 hypothetical protein GOARA_064_01260 [Gordonia araii NBRC 100433]